MVAFAVGLIVLGGALTVTLSTRGMVDGDQARTQVNQDLRASMDLIGVALRQAGERLPADFPAIEISNGAAGAPDRLILRRNLVDAVLPLCQSLGAGNIDPEVRIADGGASSPPGCAPVGDVDGNGWPDNLDAWRTERAAAGGALWVYLYNPVDRQGQWVLYDADGTTTDFVASGSGEPWLQDHDVAEQCRLYVLEERTYQIDAGLLQYVVTQDATGAINLSDRATDFQVRAHLEDGSVVDGFGSADQWTQIRSIEVLLAKEADAGKRSKSGTLTARFFPRNILSN
jgi:type IV pilus assembly protein PilW